ncbi:MAG TPA: hypothetical protein VG328_23295 [Stellaceae bacterium]|jgi:hypothetical protein|nr:hypothetical protein [Stellaceae bacterium]
MGTGIPPGWFPARNTLLSAGNVPDYSNDLFRLASASTLLLSGVLSNPPPPPYGPQWVYVRQRFTKLLANLKLTDVQRQDGATKHAGVTASLNRWYWNHNSESANSLLIGSWGKGTHIRPPRDVDILFLLPPEVYWRFEGRIGNRQSGLLQEVRGVLAQTYSQTTMRADGQVVLVPFASFQVEIAPGFRRTDGTIIVCDTKDGGRYQTSTAEWELVDLNVSDAAYKGNTRALVRLIKQWQYECKVPLKSFWIERLAIEFIAQWQYRHNDVFYYDWMVRDFLAYLIQRAKGFLAMPGTLEMVALGDAWLSRAQTAYGRAVTACDYERHNNDFSAGFEWQMVFGYSAPLRAE